MSLQDKCDLDGIHSKCFRLGAYPVSRPHDKNKDIPHYVYNVDSVLINQYECAELPRERISDYIRAKIIHSKSVD